VVGGPPAEAAVVAERRLVDRDLKPVADAVQENVGLKNIEYNYCW
jgi:hypothetical protein